MSEKEKELKKELDQEENMIDEEDTSVTVESVDKLNEQKENEYAIRIQEAEIEIERLENIALANEDNEEAIEAYKDAKENYKLILSEYRAFKKSTKPLTEWDYLPKRMIIFSAIVGVLCFPVLMWTTLPLWYYPYLGFYKLFEDSLGKLFDSALSFFSYIYLGLMWFIVPLVLGFFCYKLYFSKTKTEKNKKAYMILWWCQVALIAMLLIYQIVAMILTW